MITIRGVNKTARILTAFTLAASRARALAVPAVALTAVAVVAPACSKYDQLVQMDQQAEAAWADYEASLQRRHDLIPNLVAATKAAAKHEQATLAAVTEARAQATQIKLTSEDLTDPEKVAAFQKAQDQLKGSLSRLLAIQETYPDLKANQNFRDIMFQLEGTENRILRAREQYNAAVRDYNAELAKVGGKAVNSVTGKPFKPRVYFSAGAAAHEAPKVSFD